MNDSASLPLRDIHLPDSSLWWPLAPGWWIILAVVLCSIGILIWYKQFSVYRQFKKNIRLEMQQLFSKYENDPQQLIRQLSELMRRIALHYYPQRPVAQLCGKPWLQFLDKCIDDSNTNFSEGIGKVFLHGPYQKNCLDNVDAIYALVKEWVNHIMRQGVQES